MIASRDEGRGPRVVVCALTVGNYKPAHEERSDETLAFLGTRCIPNVHYVPGRPARSVLGTRVRRCVRETDRRIVDD